MKFIFILLFSFNIYASAVVPDRDADGNNIVMSGVFSTEAYDFRGTGKSCAVTANATTICEYTVIYPSVKINGVKVIGGSIGDSINLKVLDTPTGTYSTVPNYMLKQFGFNWYLNGDDSVILPYSNVMYINMRVIVEYINSGSAKTVYFNYYLHE